MAQAQTIEEALPIVGTLPTGVDMDLAQAAGRRIREIFKSKGGGARLRSLRFVPSSLTPLGDETFQFIVNAAVEPVRGKSGAALSRAKVVDSVVTVDLGRKHAVKDVLVPFLEVETN